MNRSKTPGLALIPKLTYEHISLTSYSKMRVDLAAQVRLMIIPTGTSTISCCMFVGIE